MPTLTLARLRRALLAAVRGARQLERNAGSIRVAG